MKRVNMLVLTVFAIYNLHAQYTINFDNGFLGDIKIDTTNQNNIWQIGQPQKTIFDSAYSSPNVIVTDTINTYPTSDTSVFYCYYTWHIQNYWPEIRFEYQIDTDTLFDFGYIEASYDNGETWVDVIKDASSYMIDWFVYSQDSIGGIYETIASSGSDSLPFTGTSNTWYTFYMSMYGWDYHFPYNDTIIYKISFFSDDNETNREGWMIDDIYLSDWISGAGENFNIANTVNIFPNPASKSITITNSVEVEINYIIIYNQSAQKVECIKTPNRTIDISALKPGLYFAEIKTSEGDVMKKIIVSKN